MKKQILQLGVILTLGISLVASCAKEKTDEEAKPKEEEKKEVELMASKTPSNRVALLEDFTGVRCGYCPDGHERAKAAQEQLGKDKFIILAVHGGSYATPATGWANFTTAFGQSLISQAKVSGFPAGTINRIPADQLGVPAQITGGAAMSRGAWAFSANKVITEMSSPVNIGAKASFDPTTRLLTVNMDAYYTDGETVANNINVAFVQNKLMSRQSGASTNPYEQNHVLRHFITGQWGDEIKESTKKESIVRKTYTYTVPADYHGTAVEGGGAVKIEDCKVVVFISRGKTDILTAVEIPITIK